MYINIYIFVDGNAAFNTILCANFSVVIVNIGFIYKIDTCELQIIAKYISNTSFYVRRGILSPISIFCRNEH